LAKSYNYELKKPKLGLRFINYLKETKLFSFMLSVCWQFIFKIALACFCFTTNFQGFSKNEATGLALNCPFFKKLEYDVELFSVFTSKYVQIFVSKGFSKRFARSLND
jgi:hypothetical protein